jgi:acyl carrier protein
MNELLLQLKQQIVKALNLENVAPENIKDDDALFGEGLGLDSIDALELIVLLEKEYGIRIENPADAKKIFISVRTIAEYISENKKA